MRWTEQLREAAYDDVSLVGLKAVIIVLALILILIALSVNDKWILAGTLAWVLLP